MTKYQRPLSACERRKLSYMLDHVLDPAPGVGISSFALRWFGVSAAVIAVCIALLVKGLNRSGGPATFWTKMAPTVFMLGCFALYSAYMAARSFFKGVGFRRRFAKELVPKLRAALKHGEASVCNVTSDRVAAIEEADDAGVAFIYDLGDGTSLYLRSDYYDFYPDSPDVKDEPWPARRFEIVRASANDMLVGVFGASEGLVPFLTIPVEEMPESFRSAEEADTQKVLPGRPEEILEGFGHRPASKSE